MPEFNEKLIAPDGRTFTARSAAEYNDLRYGQGYRPASEEQPEPEPQEAAAPATPSRSYTVAAPASAPADEDDQ